MRYFKVFEYGMWRIHVLDPDQGFENLLPKGAIQIPEAEAQELQKLPPSEELLKAQAENAIDLGGRNMSRFPAKEFKEAIGHICVNSAAIEVTLRTTIWQAASVTAEVGMAFTGGTNSIEQLLKTLEALLDFRYPHLSEAFKAIQKRLLNLNTARGKYVHGLWHPTADGVMVSKYFLTRSHNDPKNQVVSLDDLYDVAEGFMKVESDITNQILSPLLPNA
ncbi:MAG: hypothetical protein ABL896_06290 [Hylemonella sp.]